MHWMTMIPTEEYCRVWIIQACESFQQIFNDDPTTLDRILWSDEATFKLNGHINRHNCVYWNEDNLHHVIQKDVNLPGVTVWCPYPLRCYWSLLLWGKCDWCFISSYAQGVPAAQVTTQWFHLPTRWGNTALCSNCTCLAGWGISGEVDRSQMANRMAGTFSQPLLISFCGGSFRTRFMRKILETSSNWKQRSLRVLVKLILGSVTKSANRCDIEWTCVLNTTVDILKTLCNATANYNGMCKY